MFVSRGFQRNILKNQLKKIQRRFLVNNVSSDFIVDSGHPDLVIPHTTLPEFLTGYQNKFETFVAVECAETKRNYTFAQLRDKSTLFSKSLRKHLKLENGDVVAIILRNIPEYLIINLGVMKANLIVSPVSPVFTPEEISRQIIDSGAKAVVTEITVHPNVKKALEIAKLTLPTIVVKTEKGQAIPENAINFDEFLDKKIDYPEIILGKPEDVVLMPYSSGTTGLPKGVELTNKNIISNVLQTYFCDKDYQKEASETHQELLPNILPFYHIFGQAIIHGLCLVGGKIITMPSFSPELFLTSLRDYKSTLMYTVPPLILMLTYHEAVKKEYLQYVKAIMSGGAPIAASDEVAFIKKFGDEIYFLQGYGMTESGCAATNLYPSIMENVESYRGSIGRPIPNTLMKIVDPEDPKLTPLGPKQTGELLMKGPQVMKSYHNLPEETKKTVTEDGWLKSGDLGYYNEDGFFFVTDRLKELIKVKGNQVAPAELEGVIRSFPGVEDAAVIGIPHETAGEVPRAYVVADKDLDVAKLDEFVKEKVAKYKHLKGGIAVVESIPKNPSGKILRKELKEEYLKKIS